MTELQILKNLVRINSQNPNTNERKIAKFISHLLHEYNIPYKLVAGSKDRCNIVGELRGKERRVLLFNGHIDTKPAGAGWITDPFEPTINDGKLYGLGACDMKGGIAAITAALIARSKEPRNGGTIVFHFVADEEMNSKYGTRYLIKNGYLNGISLAIIAEPSSMNLITKSVGNAWLKLSLVGRGSHAGTYWKGVNAINRMQELLSLIEDRFRSMRKKFSKSQEKFFPNMNVGYIHGGSHPGTVPSHCEALIDIRFFDETMRDLYLKTVSDSASELSGKRKSFSVNIESFGGGGMPAWDSSSHSSQYLENVVGFLGESYKSATKRDLKKAISLGGSDAGLISHDAGVPSLILGPGNLEQAHVANEWINIKELFEASSVYLNIMRKW